MLENDPLWYKNAIIYELHVRAFHDSVGAGMGDFRGLSQKLDYLQDLGVTAVWLLPFYPSPLKDDGYDIADYTDIHPHYGNLQDFQEFLEAAHQRGIRVVTELVVNHTSDQHPWFQRARRAPPGSPERDFYVWSDTPEKYKEARIIFKDFEHSNWAWDPVAKAHYWHRFYSHQPDLNYDNPAVWDAIFPVVDFWLGMGVDGMRLDAVPYLYEREGTNCENLPETHAFLKALRRHIDERFPARMLLSEANQWPEDAVAYFGNGDETHVAFHFPLMPRMFMSIHMEDRYPILDIMAQTPAIPENCQWCLFLRNHDELTLEMVTDEERDYMYRAYAGDARARINLGIRHRLAPLLGNNRRGIELMNGLLFSLPGTPVIYYGDEIGMGDNIYLGDRNGVRTPMHWSGDRNAGFSRANPQKLYLPVIIDPEYHYEAVNVEAQQNNPNSLLWWMKRLIALRKRYKAFGRGTLEFLQPPNRKILAYLRQYEAETILVVANLSRFVQHVELDLAKFQGFTPVELFGRNAFPRIAKQPYTLTLGPHAFYWFVLDPQTDRRPAEQAAPLATLRASGAWDDLFRHPVVESVEALLPSYLQGCRWASNKLRAIKNAMIREAFRLRYDESLAFICLIEVEYFEGATELFVVPLTFAQGQRAEQLKEHAAAAVLAHFQGAADGIVFDALEDAQFRAAILQAIAARKTYSLANGEVSARPFTDLELPQDNAALPVSSCISREEQINTSVVYGDRLILKFFRRVEEGIHPEVEVGRYLTEKAHFEHSVPVLGVIEYRRRHGEPMTLAVLHRYVPNEGTAWQYTLDELSRYFERALALPTEQQQTPLIPGRRADLLDHEPPAVLQEVVGRYLESANLLGQRTAELHRALSIETDDPAFAPEPFTKLYQRSMYQSMRNVRRRALDRLRQQLSQLPVQLQGDAQRVLDAGDVMLERFHRVLEGKITGQRLRAHGDFDLCDVLFTGKDFLIIDFEGEPHRSLTERRLKQSPLRDVASIVRSFQYAADSALLEDGHHRGRSPGLVRPEDIPVLTQWAYAWHLWVGAAFVKSYLAHAENSAFLPCTRAECQSLLETFLLEKALRELSYDLEFRPQWVSIPLRALLQQLEV